jgi:hypothetical protein
MVRLVRDYSDFYEFSNVFEHSGHAVVHVDLGGDMYVTSRSTNDPLFFLHHANVDRYFWIWQQEHPTSVYRGNNNEAMSDIARPFDVPISAIWNIDAQSGRCYAYSGGVTPIAINKRSLLRRDSCPASYKAIAISEEDIQARGMHKERVLAALNDVNSITKDVNMNHIDPLIANVMYCTPCELQPVESYKIKKIWN